MVRVKYIPFDDCKKTKYFEKHVQQSFLSAFKLFGRKQTYQANL